MTQNTGTPTRSWCASKDGLVAFWEINFTGCEASARKTSRRSSKHSASPLPLSLSDGQKAEQ